VPIVEILADGPRARERARLFGEARALCLAGDWQRGAEAFESLARRFPEDRTASFFGAESRRAGGAGTRPDAWTIDPVVPTPPLAPAEP
jgi:hypothetical protein